MVGLGIAGTAGEDNSTRNEAGQIVDGGEIGAFRLRLGDCFTDGSAGDLIQSVQGVPCSSPHDGEVYFAVFLPDGDYPGDTAIGDSADQACLNAFKPFTGSDYETSALGLWSMIPTKDSWEQIDDREVLCVVNNYDGTKKVGTARNSGI